MARAKIEENIQKSIVKAYRQLFDVVIFAVPNGGSRHMLEAVNLKATGVLAGVPDLVVLDHRGQALFLEVKKPGGKESPE